MSKYLFIGAHTDDQELSSGATTSKLVQNGHNVFSFVLSIFVDGSNLFSEWIKSQNIIGANEKSFDTFPVRDFTEHRQKILQTLVELRDDYKPDFIFTHSANSIHQDHKVVGEESLRAFKNCNLITYEHEWNLLQSESNYYIEVSEENMAKKFEAMACYKSQQHRHYFDKQFTYSRALLNGAKIGVKYAEAFRIVNMKG